MSIKLTDTQIVMLNAAAQRDDRCLLAPQSFRGGAAQNVAAKLIQAGLAKELKAKPGEPVWRQDKRAGQSCALKLTASGLKAIATDNRWASGDAKEGNKERVQVAGANSEVIRQTTAEVPTKDAPRPSAPRDGTKLARVLELLQRDCGATLEELTAATDWLPHTSRAVLTRLCKRGHAVTIDGSDKERGSKYRARSDETIDLEQAGSQSDDPPRISAAGNSKTAQRSPIESALGSVMGVPYFEGSSRAGRAAVEGAQRLFGRADVSSQRVVCLQGGSTPRSRGARPKRPITWRHRRQLRLPLCLKLHGF